ncbi:hypothetical protein [Leptolyngbya sp. NIES-2104]|uniref:hypothetical protein n=1 Tax=Leptolyngbya sp. NIES-2104 TaxID=1552121 RepID=UPI0006EC750C|nr:hypothetical protein [Leptolyngbya sp. NIES-2104]GAP94760.1 hypothetical protein NIES2104_12770 [Leptolyngbya sp. NIES-2104]
MNLPFVLDVAIGLIFTYLILSLLASELQELTATVLQWRAKHLRDSIEVLLGGGINTPEQQRVQDLVARLYDDPLLRNVNQEAKGVIAQGFRRITRILFPGNRPGAFGNQASGPSYIAPETFATSLIEQLGITSMVDKLSQVRFERFVKRIVGHYWVNEFGEVGLSADDMFESGWERGAIREIAAKSNQVSLSADLNFRVLVEDYHDVLKAYQTGQANLETSVERLGEGLDAYISACANLDQSSPDTVLYVRRLRAYKSSVFGQNNDRVVISGGLKPSIAEIAELVNQGTNTHQEVAGAYDRVANQARPIDAQVNASIQSQIEDYRMGLDPNALDQPTKFEDLDYDLQQIFLANALKDLTSEERQMYEEYQSYKKIRSGLSRLPDAVKDSMSILARRAQTRVEQGENQVNQFRDEVAVWFDRSMSRASGVYKRNAKGVALLVGLFLAATTNSDTFHIFNRLSSDDSLRQLVTDRAAQLNLNAERSPRFSAQLEELKNETDAVLREIAFPISWNSSNLGRQLGCPSSGISATAQNQSLTEANQLKAQWENLYKECLNTNQASTAPVPLQVAEIMFNRPLGVLQMLFGWIVSGIAIAMGAPFWFDLLGKVVNVRNAGGKPRLAAGEEQKTN